jgi:hypothetical protein
MNKLLPSRPAGRAAVAAALASAAVFVNVASAHAATYPVHSFYVPVGATYTDGTATFYNRSVIVNGVERAEGGECRWTTAYSYDANKKLLDDQIYADSPHCVAVGGSPQNWAFTINLNADEAGGAAYIVITFMGMNPDGSDFTNFGSEYIDR